DDYVKAGEAVIDRSNWDSADDPDRQRAFVATNSEALRLLHLGLTRECRFPLQRWRTNLNNLAPMFGSFKFLCHLLVAEGHVRELDGRTNEAVASYLDAMKFGNEIGRGGVLVNRLVGL